jgi:hypothetical protein
VNAFGSTTMIGVAKGSNQGVAGDVIVIGWIAWT